MRHSNEWIDVPKFVFEGLHNLKDLLSSGDYIISYDLTSGFNHIEIHPTPRRLVGFRWQGKHYVYNVLPFGLRIAPYAFAKTVSVFVARSHRGGINVLPYLDVFLFSRHL
jgi:hypothetical protein